MTKTFEEQKQEVIASFVPPRFPYVAFVARRKVSRDGVMTEEAQPFVLPVDAHHADPYRIDAYVAKGWTIFDYRMPSESEKKVLNNKFRGSTNFGDDVDQWRELETKLEVDMGRRDDKVRELESETAELRKRVAKLLEEKEAKKTEAKGK
jgi:hypothetical protein